MQKPMKRKVAWFYAYKTTLTGFLDCSIKCHYLRRWGWYMQDNVTRRKDIYP